MNIINEINTMHRFTSYSMMDELEKSLELVDLEDIGEELLHDDIVDVNIVQKYIQILNYIENETSIVTPVSDDIYDQIVEKYKDLGGTKEVGVDCNTNQSSPKIFKEHKYPELRGSLNKVHFIYESEVPKKDSRKSLEHFLSVTEKILQSKQTDINFPVCIIPDLKWDGVSHVFEMSGRQRIDHVLTRYDVSSNLGVDITHIFKYCDINELLFSPLPKGISYDDEFGLKVETFMPTEYFNKYVKDMGDDRCNRRSAITSIVNQAKDQFNLELLDYLAIQPLQIASERYIELQEDDYGWNYIGEINGHHQYIFTYAYKFVFDALSFHHLVTHLDEYPIRDSIEGIRISAGDTIPIDGVVFTILDLNIIQVLGRNNDKNKFQIAFKFPQGVKKTILKDVEFPVGPAASTITPRAIVKPVVINGNTISYASLSNFEKMERLDLRIGDEVIIKYDIIPKLEKDDSCKKGTGKRIERPVNCPICGSDLKGGNRCLNVNCDSRLSGKIKNYLKKMKIKSIGEKTVEKFVSLGYLKSISDLYRLPRLYDEIVNLPGYGVTSYTNMLTAILSRTSVYPHEFLGALGIPDISTETMKKICMETDIIHASEEELKKYVPKLTEIHGIGEITAKKIITGILDRLDEIEAIIIHLEFLDYPSEMIAPKEIVLFTGFRDSDFAEYLESINIKVANSYLTSLTYLITADNMKPNAKVERALKEHIPVISATEAKTMFHYTK